jgi:hypothetical protein
MKKELFLKLNSKANLTGFKNLLGLIIQKTLS